jgi:sugar transferase (PEP-CTERM/EpsH1 system associated)
MHILLLAPYPPYPPRSGGALRIYNLLRGLAQRHHVTCLTFVPDAQALMALEPLRACCRVVTVWGLPRRSTLARTWTTLASPQPDMALRNASPAYRAALRWLLRTQQYDIVQAESIEMAGYGLLAADTSARLVLDQFNAEYVLQQRAALNDLRHPGGARRLLAGGYSLAQWAKLAAYERRMLRAYQQVVTVSAEDRAALLRLLRRDQRAQPPCAISVVPNGVDTAFFAPQPAPALSDAQPPTLVFTGTLDYRPNVDAARWFAAEVLPRIRAVRPEVRVLLVGRTPGPAVRSLHDGTTIIVQGDVPDVRPAIAGAAVYVVPMRIGGGIRLKLLEALAMEAPVVCTSMGAEGVNELRHDEHLLLADTPADFAAAVLRLLADPAEGRRLGSAGRRLAQQHYDWDVIVPRLEASYRAG